MSAPSFSSFPPSFSSFPDLEPGPSKPPSKPSREDREKYRDKPTREGRRSKEKGEKDRTRKRDKHKHKDAEHSRSERRQRDSEQWSADPPRTEEPQQFYYLDRKGDPLNIQYGGLHAGDVPKYRLVAGGRQILGLSNAWSAFSRTGKGVEIGVRNRRKMASLTDSSARALLAAPPVRRILQSSGASKYEEIDGFIRLPARRGRQNPEESYRSITLAKDEENSDSESSSASEREQDGDSSTDDDDSPVLTSHQETLKSLEQQLTADPSSVDDWLLLLTHTISTIPIISKNATKARSEITLSILARALSADRRNASSKVLRLKYLKAGEEIWHESKVRAEWEDALKVGGVEIWMEWLEWRIRKGNNGMDGVVDAASRAIAALGDDEEGEIGMVRVFWRVALAFRNAGFSERAMAMFQAQAELSFEIPQALYGLPLPTLLDELEEFWESEVPRIGEEGSKGWAHWVRNHKHGHVPAATSTTQPSAPTLDLDPYRQWATQEFQADRTTCLPKRSTDESADADPYATVLFADIRPLLLNLSTARAKDAFRTAWLSLLGLHVPGFSLSLSASRALNWDDRWSEEHLTYPAYLDALFPSGTSRKYQAAEAAAGVVVGREKEYAESFGQVKCWGYGVVGPLDVGSGQTQRGLWGKEDVSGVDVDVVRRVFAGLRYGSEDGGWDALALAFEAAVNVKSAIKRSKEFLSTARESVPHWGAHAQLERMRGRLDEARKVYQTVLIASRPNRMQVGVSELWWNWAEMEWLDGGDEQALNVILRSVGIEDGRTGVAILRGKRLLEEAVDSMSDRQRWKEREAWIRLRALLELVTGSEIASMLGTVDRYLSMDAGSIEHESLMVGCLMLVYHYGVTLKNVMPPSVLRERVEKALEEYPSNSVILGLFLEGEKGQGVWGRVRGMLGGSDGKAKDVARRVEEVWIAGWEKGRWEGEVERTRSGLAAAVEMERTRASVVIWRVYIEFEIRAGELQRAKKLLFRAIGECPLVKELYLLAFGPLRGVFNGHELSGLADTMAERGIRLRQGLDEVVDIFPVEEGRERDSAESGDEIEYNARELRRLMPY